MITLRWIPVAWILCVCLKVALQAPLRASMALLVGLALATAPALADAPAPQLAARSWLLLDLTSGTLLASHEADRRAEPASLTKLMTAYLVFEAIGDERLTLEQRPPVSARAYKAAGSRMFVDPRHPARVDELLNGLIVQSGNDAAIVLAEAIAKSEDRFVDLMNAAAKRMGLSNTHFTNASGWPDPEQYSTARDLATLSSRLITDYPDFYQLYSQREYTFNNIRQPNRNRLLFIDPTVDGVKTGHTEAAGYCLISSAQRAEPGTGLSRRLLSVVLGTDSETSRAIESQKLLNFGFQNFQLVRLYKKNEPIETYKVYMAKDSRLTVGFADDVVMTVPRSALDRLKGEIERTEPLFAPIAAGTRVGTLLVQLEEQTVLERPLIALSKVEVAGWFGRAWDTIKLWTR